MNYKRIKEAYLGFSSGHEPKKEEMDFLIAKECECDDCGTNVLEKYDFPNISIEDNELLCEDCYMEKYFVTCSVCEEHFNKPEEPCEHRFYIGRLNAKEIGVAPGIYQVNSFPFYYGNIVSGFESFFEEAIDKISDTNIEQISRIKHERKESMGCDYMCPDCFDMYTGKSYIKNNYVNRAYGLHLTISIRGLIKKP